MKCNACDGDTISIGGRKRMCPKCETDGLPQKEEKDPFGFEIKDPPIEVDKGPKIDIDIDFDFDLIKEEK